MTDLLFVERVYKQLAVVTDKHREALIAGLNKELEPGEWATFVCPSNPMVTGRYMVTPNGTPHLEFSDTGEMAFEAMCYRDTIAVLMNQHGSISQSVIYALWNVYSTGMVAHMGNGKTEYNAEDLTQWAIDTFTMVGDEAYIRQWVYVVERVLMPVYAAANSGVPYLDKEGLPLTPETIINMEKRLTHLISISSTFAKSDRPTQEELLQTITDPDTTRKEVRELVKEIADGGKEKVVIPYRVEEEVFDGTEYRTIFLPHLDDKQYKLFKSLIGAVGEQIFDEHEGTN